MGASTPALRALTDAQVAFTCLEYTHDPRTRAFGDESVAALGLDAGQVFKTLVALVDGQPTVGIVPVSRQLDLKALASAIGGRKAEMAPIDLAERVTGYVVGGISPIGQKRRLPMVLDEEAILCDVIYVSGGRRGLTLGITPADVQSVTGAVLAAIARGGPP